MDIGAFKAQLDAARGFEHTAAGASFRLQLPSDHAWRLALESHRDAHGRLLEARALRAVLDAALVGWGGVTAATILPGAGADPIAFSAEARALLLDHRQDIADELAIALGLRIAERRAAREAVTKN